MTTNKMETNISDGASEPLITTETREDGRVCLITLNRPFVLNAISHKMSQELQEALKLADADPNVRALVLTGSGNRSFSVGADIKELSVQTPESAVRSDFLTTWERSFATLRKPIIAAVDGYALGGGFELALLCDVVYCSEGSSFGLPEVRLGTIPGGGGTQRLTNAIGKSNASRMILTGGSIRAAEALRLNVVSKVCAEGCVVDESVALAKEMGKVPPTAVQLAKQAIGVAMESTHAGLDAEKRLYYLSFGTDGFREGVTSFMEKRMANFENC